MPFLSTTEVTGLKAELPTYIIEANGVGISLIFKVVETEYGGLTILVCTDKEDSTSPAFFSGFGKSFFPSKS